MNAGTATGSHAVSISWWVPTVSFAYKSAVPDVAQADLRVEFPDRSMVRPISCVQPSVVAESPL